ncbi:MAG: Eco57I restriction-modification methylase domain-containing protein, partial [Acetobacteraceae bacterium]
MTTLPSSARKQLENTVRKARSVADCGARDVIARLGIAAAVAPPHLSEAQKELRRRLRAHARSLGDRREADGAMETRHLAEAAAYEHWHRMLFGRFLVERNLLIHPKHGVPIARGELKELAEEEGFADEWALVERIAAPNLPGIFKPNDPLLALEIDPHFQARLRMLVTALPEEIFAADDSLGWTYQFWRADEKKRVNEAQGKIGADELPAVTQLFTEPYMVKFLLHNTLGAWWAGKILVRRPDLAREAPDESALRAACALPGIDWEYLRFVHEDEYRESFTDDTEPAAPFPSPSGRGQGEGASHTNKSGHKGNGPWRPAAGTFPGWPKTSAEITYLDPCCGSGHFLIEAFAILAALRHAEEGLSPAEAACAVLRDNLHGLEIDGRCVQIATFGVALAAWHLAGGQITLPVPHIAWVGAPPPLPKSEFIALANGDAELQRGLAALHDLFQQAPLLGSLIELAGGDLVDPTRIARLDQSIKALVEKMRHAEPERAEGALAARGMADAAAILARRFTLLATNPPFLGARDMESTLNQHLNTHFPAGKGDLATAMLLRMLRLNVEAGLTAAVLPQNWLFLESYRTLRNEILQQIAVRSVAY